MNTLDSVYLTHSGIPHKHAGIHLTPIGIDLTNTAVFSEGYCMLIYV